MEKKLIYILNQYSSNSVQHFYHITHLLTSMADKGVKIALVIEKCDERPDIVHENIEVICQQETTQIKRVIELSKILKELVNRGYKKIFIRITINSTIIAIVVGKLFGAKVYYWQSGTTYEVDKDKDFFNKIKWYLKSYSKFWIVKTFVDFFVTGPESMIEYYHKVVKVKKQKLLLLYNDIDLNRFSVPSLSDREVAKKALGFENDEKIILMVHRLSPVRKTDLYIPRILESANFIDNNIHLVIIGEGPELPILQSNISKSIAKYNIHLLGSKPNSEITKYYIAADVFINPSYTEGFPRVVIEAMASGLPIVATDAGGTRDLFGPKQREFIINKDAINSFRSKLAMIVDNEKIQNELSQENIDVVNRFSTEEVSRMYIERIFE